MTYRPEVFPTTFSILYCPLPECPVESPFPAPRDIIQHVEACHHAEIIDPEAVFPILDRYLQSLVARIGSRTTFGGPDDKEDHSIRHRLQSERLENILNTQQQERQSSFKAPGQCLFCPDLLPDKYALFAHMYHQHSFNIGQLDNLVLVDEFLQILRDKLQGLVCIYCEKQFKDSSTLTKHIKTKAHFKINSHNSRYDRFYIVNYMLPGTTWHDLAADLATDLAAGLEDASLEDDRRDSWSDLDEPVDMHTCCLMCEARKETPDLVVEHMQREHQVDLKSLFSDFYDGIKVVNFFRLCWRDVRCAFCGLQEESGAGLTRHYQHCNAREKNELVDEWRAVENMFPFYDDDSLLFILD